VNDTGEWSEAEWSEVECSEAEWSEAKFGTFLFCHSPLNRFDFILDPHKVMTGGLTGSSSLNALDKGAAAMDELVTQY
jgi:hypothetical protein